MTTWATSWRKGRFRPRSFPWRAARRRILPEDIAAPLVAGKDAVADEESHGAAVIGNDADGDVVLRIFPVGPAADLFDDDG